VAGTLWHLNNVFGYLFVARVFTNNTIYGSLYLLPVFMVGIYFSWVILLFGVQVAYAYQNRAAYLQDRLADNVNQRGREFVALRLMTCLGQRFQNGLRPATVFQLSTVLRILAGKQLVTEVAGHEAGFVPARPLDTINAYDIILAMRTGTGQDLPLREEALLTEIYGEFARIEKAERETASAISLLSLANRLPPRPALAEPKTVPAGKPVEISEAPARLPDFPPSPEPTLPPPATETVSPGQTSAPPAETPEPVAAGRREVVMPDENREFPL